MGSQYQLFCSRLLETVKEQCLVVWLKLLLDHPKRKNTRSTTHLLSYLYYLCCWALAASFCNIFIYLLILLALNFPQGTNNSFVFTDTSGCPVIYRPTGIFNWVWVCHYGYTVLCLVSKSIIGLWMTKSINEHFDFKVKYGFAPSKISATNFSYLRIVVLFCSYKSNMACISVFFFWNSICFVSSYELTPTLQE